MGVIPSGGPNKLKTCLSGTYEHFYCNKRENSVRVRILNKVMTTSLVSVTQLVEEFKHLGSKVTHDLDCKRIVTLGLSKAKGTTQGQS